MSKVYAVTATLLVALGLASTLGIRPLWRVLWVGLLLTGLCMSIVNLARADEGEVIDSITCQDGEDCPKWDEPRHSLALEPLSAEPNGLKEDEVACGKGPVEMKRLDWYECSPMYEVDPWTMYFSWYGDQGQALAGRTCVYETTERWTDWPECPGGKRVGDE